MKKLRSPEEARAWLNHQGISISEWSRRNHVHDSLVREILAGRKKCGFGTSHNIAVLLGMKQGELTRTPGRATRHTELNGVAA